MNQEKIFSHLVQALGEMGDLKEREGYSRGYLTALNDLKTIVSDRLDHEEVRTQWVIFEIDSLMDAAK